MYYQFGNYYQSVYNYPQTFRSFQQAITYLQQSGKVRETSRAMYCLARAYDERGVSLAEFKQINQNLAFAERTNFHGYDCSNYAILYFLHINRGENNAALAILKVMLRQAQLTQEPVDLHAAYTIYGRYYELAKQYHKALAYNRKALLAAHQLGSLPDEILTHSSVARILFLQDRIAESQAVLTEVRAINRKAGFFLGDHLLILQARIFERQHQIDSALVYIDQVVPVVRHINPHMLTQALEIQIRLQKKKGHFRQALASLEELKTVSDSLLDVNKLKAIASLKAQIDFDKQSRDMAVLKKNSTILQLQIIQTRQQRLLYASVAIGLLLLIAVVAWFGRQAQRNVRTLQFQKQEITEQATRLTQLNSVKDKLFALIGHDLRTPVFQLRSNLIKLANQDTTRPQDSDMLAKLSRTVNTLHSTLDNLLHWSALQRNGIFTKATHVSLSAITQDILKLFETTIELKNLTIELDSSHISAWADEIQTQVIMRNVIHNAVKFTPSGGTIQISYQQVQTQAMVEIRDTGIGMRADKPVGQLSGEGEQGTGLGLVITREFLDLNGGHITITSTIDQGTCVRLFFPLEPTGAASPGIANDLVPTSKALA